MAEKPSSDSDNGIFGVIKEGVSLFWGLIIEMWKFFIETFPQIFKMGIWIIAGIFILPCVFVASNIYPKWTDWGEKM